MPKSAGTVAVTGANRGIGAAIALALARATDLAMRVATDAVQLYGGCGYCKDYRVERLLRDAK